MSDDVRWVVQATATGRFFATPLYSMTWTDTGDLAYASLWNEEIVALRFALLLPNYCRVRAVRRVPAKGRWEECESAVGTALLYRLCKTNIYHADIYIRELPPEPSDRWELVPE